VERDKCYNSDTPYGLREQLFAWHCSSGGKPTIWMSAIVLLLIIYQKSVLQLEGRSDRSVDALLLDLQKVLGFLSSRLPSELLQPLCAVMMEDLIPKVINVWLDSAVPSSLKGMVGFQNIIQSAGQFCNFLNQSGFSGFDALKYWVGSAPAIWLAKCRETALGSVRDKLSNG
jgi:protein transport protein DSL1/ZW10